MNDDFLQERSVDTKNGKIVYYTDTLFPGRPVVVFLHGLSANHTTWIPLIRQLHSQKYNSIAIDMRGHGLSDKKKIRSLYNFSVFAEDVKNVVDNEGIEKFTLVGYSFGGVVALQYATQYQSTLDGFIVLSTNHVNPFFYKGIHFLAPAAYWFLTVLAALLLWQRRKQYYYFTHKKSPGYWHSTWVGMNTMPISVNFWMLSQMFRIDFRESIKRVFVPAIIVRSKRDPFVTEVEAKNMAAAFPNGQLVIAAHENHFLAFHAYEEISQIILNFLKSVCA